MSKASASSYVHNTSGHTRLPPLRSVRPVWFQPLRDYRPFVTSTPTGSAQQIFPTDDAVSSEELHCAPHQLRLRLR